ncbi:cupin domain-containing protein [Roseomonas sp. ACRSG]|nr:cupin domain-containing protein [Roseomonas sp. ACRSG]
MAFNPNQKSLAACIAEIKDIAERSRIASGKIITSKDKEVRDALGSLDVSNVPSGFTKWRLPVYLNEGSTFYFSYAPSGTTVPEHSHDEGDGLRVIMNGSIVYNDVELTSGDWMFLPKGQRYSFKVGKMGVGMFYCYSCCCA